MADLEATRRELKRVEIEIGRIVSRSASAADDLWEIFEKEIAAKREAKNRLMGMVAEARLAAEDADAASLISLSEYCARVRDRLAEFGFAEKRLALEALCVKIRGNGREWQMDVSLPAAGLSPQSS